MAKARESSAPGSNRCYHVKCVRRLALPPTLVGVGVVVLMADRKGRDAVSGKIKGMQIKDDGAVEAGAEPKQNGSCRVDSYRCVPWNASSMSRKRHRAAAH